MVGRAVLIVALYDLKGEKDEMKEKVEIRKSVSRRKFRDLFNVLHEGKAGVLEETIEELDPKIETDGKGLRNVL